MELFLYDISVFYYSVVRFLRLVVFYPVCMIKIMMVKRNARNFSNAVTNVFDDAFSAIDESESKLK
ncbi:MAG: hypothetical protein RR854_00060 [Muribaculaceae bacterium]